VGSGPAIRSPPGRPAPRPDARASATASGSHQQERRAPALIGPGRVRRDLLFGRTPFLDMRDGKAQPNEHVDVGRYGPVLFDDAFGEPIRRPWALVQVSLDRPNLAAGSIERPLRLGRSRENRMFHL